MKVRIGSSTVMTHHPVLVFMPGEAYITGFAHRNPSAGGALYIGRKTAPVLKQDYLFMRVQSLLYLKHQLRTEMRTHRLFFLLNKHIHNLNNRHLYVPETSGEAYEAIFTQVVIKVTLQGRSGGTEKNFRLVNPRHHNCSIPCVITGSRIELFEGVFVLLIHNNETQIFER